MDVPFGDALGRFVDFLASERRASRHTVQAYRRDLTQLGTFLVEKQGEDTPIGRIDVYLLRQWLGSLTRVVGTASVARKIAAIKAFFRYLQKTGVLDKDPAAELASPKVRRPLPTFLGVDAAREVMEAPDVDNATGARDRALLELLYGSGLRVSELSGVDLGDLDLGGQMVRVLGKGRKERVVPLGRASIRAIEAYLERRTRS